MKTKSMKLALLTLCGLILLPHTIAAYEVTDSQALRLNDNTLLFTISYKLGFLNRDMATPIYAERNSAADDKVGYDILVNGEAATGIVGAVVLSDDENVTPQEEMYVLPERKNGIFTLVGIVRTDAEIQSAEMKINSLPYITHHEGEFRLSKITGKELEDFRSPTLLIRDEGVISIKTSVTAIETSEK